MIIQIKVSKLKKKPFARFHIYVNGKHDRVIPYRYKEMIFKDNMIFSNGIYANILSESLRGYIFDYLKKMEVENHINTINFNIHVGAQKL